MLTGEDAYLFSALSQYGYSLFQPDQMADPNDLLARLSQSQDMRLLEGFPVVLANAMEKRESQVDLSAAENSLTSNEAREKFRKLVALSLYLFDVFGFENLKPAAVRRSDRWKTYLKELRDVVENNLPLKLGDQGLDLDRVKKTFVRYAVRDQVATTAEDKARLKDEFRREYYFSLLLSPRQRELVQKKLRAEPMTKTEREYFSRVVKKKLQALVDPDLHRMAQKALQG